MWRLFDIIYVKKAKKKKKKNPKNMAKFVFDHKTPRNIRISSGFLYE